MSPRLKSFLQRWLINTLAVLVAANIVPGIAYERAVDLFLASLLLGILNSLVRPVLLFVSMVVTLPLVLLTLGLFILVLTTLINAGLLYLVGLMKGFEVAGFWAAFWGALVISLVSLVVNRLVGTDQRKQATEPTTTPRTKPPPGKGPIIDV
jgi:putative membrane protein